MDSTEQERIREAARITGKEHARSLLKMGLKWLAIFFAITILGAASCSYIMFHAALTPG